MNITNDILAQIIWWAILSLPTTFLILIGADDNIILVSLVFLHGAMFFGVYRQVKEFTSKRDKP